MSSWSEAFKSANVAGDASKLINHARKVGGAVNIPKVAAASIPKVGVHKGGRRKTRKSRKSRRSKSRRM
jgi:hypothetical protein